MYIRARFLISLTQIKLNDKSSQAFRVTTYDNNLQALSFTGQHNVVYFIGQNISGEQVFVNLAQDAFMIIHS